MRVITLPAVASAFFLLALPLHSAPASPSIPATLQSRCVDVLRDVLRTERNWVGVHAAEELVASGHASDAVAALQSDAGAYPRVGRARVLATMATSIEERRKALAALEAIAGDAQAADRKQAIESLAKLGHRVSPDLRASLAAHAAAQPPEQAIVTRWCLYFSDDRRDTGFLAAALQSTEPLARQRAGYILRWLQPRDPKLLGLVARTAQHEPPATIARVFLVSAARQLNAEPGLASVWHAELKETLLHGDSSAARYEAAHGLRGLLASDDTASIAAALAHPDPDTRVAAAALILSSLPSP
jgi:hypothetical protein